jgi:uncharacterized membrane protein YeiH
LLQPTVDLLGVFAFALKGGALGVERQLDILGVALLAR